MAITYTWEITRMRVIDQPPLTQVATQACFDIHGEEDGLKGFAQSDVMLNPPNPEQFLSLDSVSHEQAVQWVKNALGDRLKMYEDMIALQIESQKVQQPVEVKMPWMKQD